MSWERRAKQREFLHRPLLFFDKSLVRSFSFFEKPPHRLGYSPYPAGLCIIDMAFRRLLVRTPPAFPYGVV